MTEQQAIALVEAARNGALQLAWEAYKSESSPITLRNKLERDHPAEVCRAFLDCLTSREHFQDKFWRASDWLLTREAAEQASHWLISRWRAQHLSGDLTEVGCGIGGDSVFLSQSTNLTCFEKEPARTLLARSNIEQLGQGALVECREVHLRDLTGEVLFCDPARRASGRIHNPDDWQPSLSEVASCFTSGRFTRVLIKTAPGIKDEALSELPSPETTFISVDGQLKEAQVHLGGVAQEKAAVLLTTGSELPLTYKTKYNSIPIEQPAAGRYLFNPDPAILRADALDHLAEEIDAGIVHPKIGYLVGAKPASSPAFTSFKILDTFALNWSHLKKWIKQSDWTDYEYLGRGVPFSQPEVRKKLPRLKSKKPYLRGSVIIYRTDSGYQVVVAQRQGKSAP